MRALGELDPRHVGPFQSVARLDVDEMGAVLLGRAPDGRLAAIKLVSSHLVTDPGFSPRFAHEVTALRHAAGDSVIDAGPADSTPWLAVEFLPGVSLRQVVDRGLLFGEDAVLRLATGLVGALTGLHGAGLVHRDLTPVNVLLNEDDVRVVDFGVARAVDRDMSLVVGTAEFMSPEQAGGRPLTPATDVFSLGAVLHLAATGRGPFDGATRAETLAQVAAARPNLSPALPPRVRTLVAACLAKDPQERPTLDQLRAMITPVAQPWPAPVRQMIVDQQAEIGRLAGAAPAPAAPHTVRVAPVVVPAAPPPRRKKREPEPERWKPDMWAVVSGGAIVVAVVFAIVMFNVLTPDRPLRASEQTTSKAPATTTTTATEETTTTTTTTEAQEPPSGEVTGLAGKCVDVAGARTDNGTPVQLQECNGTDAQQWEFTTDGAMRALGKCLDVTGGANSDGTTVQLYDCNDTKAQQWVVTTEGWILNVGSNKCLDVPGKKTDDGTQLIIWTCHGEENQIWSPPA